MNGNIKNKHLYFYVDDNEFSSKNLSISRFRSGFLLEKFLGEGGDNRPLFFTIGYSFNCSFYCLIILGGQNLFWGCPPRSRKPAFLMQAGQNLLLNKEKRREKAQSYLKIAANLSNQLQGSPCLPLPLSSSNLFNICVQQED